MSRLLLLMLPLCVLISGCQTTNKSNVCSGFSRLTPTLETSVYVLKNDRKFGDQVAAHNRFGTKEKCW